MFLKGCPDLREARSDPQRGDGDSPSRFRSADLCFQGHSHAVEFASRLKSVPLLIRHDEADMTPPFQESVLFIARSREAGVDASFVPTEGNVHVFSQNPMEEKRALFEFFRGKKRHSATLKPVANHAKQEPGIGSGPIEDAFGAPVLIVEGTKGTAARACGFTSPGRATRRRVAESLFCRLPREDGHRSALRRDKKIQSSWSAMKRRTNWSGA